MEDEKPAGSDPLKVITVRMPKSLRERLKGMAHNQRVSMNTLCVELLDAATTKTTTAAAE